MEDIKKFIRELRRTRWPKPSEIKKTYWKTIVFVLIFALISFGLTLGLTSIWDGLGVGL